MPGRHSGTWNGTLTLHRGVCLPSVQKVPLHMTTGLDRLTSLNPTPLKPLPPNPKALNLPTPKPRVSDLSVLGICAAADVRVKAKYLDLIPSKFLQSNRSETRSPLTKLPDLQQTCSVGLIGFRA